MKTLMLFLWMSGQTCDIGSTVAAQKAGAVESNPIALPALKGAVAAGGAAWILKTYDKHPKLTWAIVAGSVVGNGLVTAHNLDVARQMGRR